MSAHYLAQQLINALSHGSILALLAIGYTMIYGILGLINFAHGEIFMIGAYIERDRGYGGAESFTDCL